MTQYRMINALLRQPFDKTPVWIMRQAGRYLPEFRQLRAKMPQFLDFCKNPELACEATLQPLERFDLDAAIIFSDILTVIDAMGFHLEFVSGEGPVVYNPVRCLQAIEAASVDAAIERLQYVYEAVRITRAALLDRVPLIGFAGSPWTVACYLVEGRNQKNFQTIRAMMYRDPVLLNTILDKLTELSIHYLNQQIAAGAQIIMLFDSWGGLLSDASYEAFSLRYMRRIGEGLQRIAGGRTIPLIFFTKNGGLWLEQTASAGCDAVGLDWSINLADARQRVGDQVALQGNLDPMALYGTPDTVNAAVKQMITAYGGDTGYVVNLGHGIDKDTPIENVAAMIDAVREFG